ncbi:alpha/beta fold hydrolase [Pseudarthrobacter sulfonivorans]|uniref:alpha/beta fold hydrolase n=1 Tax=Pseudarthrobacter sulfonivorans TaxID=121292 RepID=UPI00168A4A9C|nr:alpha/beta hydrolase [Pseudarthrobacter sulfonivorans]
MPFVEVNGQRLWFTDTGGDGIPVVFLHGFLMDGTMFDFQVAALGATFRSITLDERCHGRTQESDETFTFWNLADDAIALLDHLGIGSAAFVGMSQGGFVVQRIALAHPGRVLGLILLNTEARDMPDEHKVGRVERFKDWIANGPGVNGPALAGKMLGDPALEAHWIKRWEAMDPRRIARANVTLMERDSVLDRLGEITCPVLQVHGTADEAINMVHAEQLFRALPGRKTFVKIDGARHSPNLTHPKIVNEAIKEFLANISN